MRRRLLIVLGVIALAAVALVLLALPFRSVPGDAEAARDDLTLALDALQAGDVDAARERVAAARAHVDGARDVTHGVSGTIWRFVPVAGGAVQDVRHLVAALDEIVSVAEIGVQTYPAVRSRGSTLVTGDRVDVDALVEVVDAAQRAAVHVDDAQAELDEVSDEAVYVGTRLAEARDTAQAELAPLQRSYDAAGPLLEALPRVVGAEEDLDYLIAMLNPAELRYSGGAALTLTPMTASAGRLSFGPSLDMETLPRSQREFFWKKVPGNPFHARGKEFFQNATFSPYWSQSGEELLRAFERATGDDRDAVLAVDVVALSSLLTVTGPLDVPGAGTFDAANLTERLVGSYDRFDDEAARKRLNGALIPIFRDRFLDGGRFTQKLDTLRTAARGRHFAMYFRDPDAQEAFSRLGLAGDLSGTDHDYLGVFTQNVNAAKVDYWQQRGVSSDVELRRDGSADVWLRVTLDNLTPPYTRSYADPRSGYFTRWSRPAIGVFLPHGARVESAFLGGLRFDPFVGEVLGRPYLYRTATLAPGASETLLLRYRVPRAAVVGDDGSLTYRLDVDPQGMVNAQDVTVRVRWPKGYAVPGGGGLPAGWTRADPRTASWAVDAMSDSPRFAITADVRRSEP